MKAMGLVTCWSCLMSQHLMSAMYGGGKGVSFTMVLIRALLAFLFLCFVDLRSVPAEPVLLAVALALGLALALESL